MARSLAGRCDSVLHAGWTLKRKFFGKPPTARAFGWPNSGGEEIAAVVAPDVRAVAVQGV
ncbi:hypothetical protein GCM10022207_18110 [Streptomyces lannensis]|uniref:Uncharacterized protein n=1 Tax=Streptomyces lannensis TaxID=766498 RepID=A0ABP7JVY3_9ACTN